MSCTKLESIFPTNGSNPDYLTNVNGTLFFRANNGVNGYELWKSDGTTTGTILVKDIKPGSISSYPSYSRYLTNVNGTLFFSADDGVNGRELWKSDGTAAGTVLVKDINPGSSRSQPRYLTNVNGTLFFRAYDGVNGWELWKSDGTAAGTVLIKDINPGSSSNPSNLTNVNGTLFFKANDGVNGYELWKSDGTAAGTVLVKDINPGSGIFGSNPRNLTNVNGTLFFTADDGVNGDELWKSDGTAAGTVLIKDINPGSNSSNISDLTNMNGILYFTADDGVNSTKIWRSDGTTAGTVIADPAVLPSDLVSFLSDLYFSAVDSSGDGRGLQVLTTLPTITLAVSPASVQEDGTTNLTYTFTRTKPTDLLTVNYSVGGTATFNSDYTQTGATSFSNNAGTVTFAAGSSTITLTIDPTADTTVESDETVALTLETGTSYARGTTEAVIGTIANDDLQANEGVLLGTPQNDTLDATPGQYTVIPFTGDDTILVNTASDVIIELPNEGTDTIVSSVNYNLAAHRHIENLTLTGTDDITGIGNRRDNIITANSGQNVLVGLQGNDTFVFNFGDSSVAKPDRIRDFEIGHDRLLAGGLALDPQTLTSASDSSSTTLEGVVNSVFTDFNGALSGNQALDINSAALVIATARGIGGTYVVVNDGLAGFNAESDLVIKIAESSGSDFSVSYL